MRESPAAAARRSNRCLIVSGCGGLAVLDGEHVVAGVIVVSDLRRCWGRRVVVRFNPALTVVFSRLTS